MNKISVVIITLNEERNIARCLDSVQDVADEIVVVDSYSTDATEQLCRQRGVRFISHSWEGYVGTKNFADSQASYDLILSIDADEALSPTLSESIKWIKQQDIEGKAFSVDRLMNYCGKWIRHGGWYPDTKVRIFNRRTAQWTGQKVHETLSLTPGTEVMHLDGELLHYSFYTPEEHEKQMIRFAELSAQELADKSKQCNVATACLHTAWKWIRDYIVKGGFLDGRDGWNISKTNAYGVWYKYMKAIEIQKDKR